MNKMSPKMMVVIALILSSLIAGLTYTYLQQIASQANKPTSAVVVAKVDIPLKTKITAEMVELQQIPNDYIQPGAMMALDQVVGIVAREQVLAGEQINQRVLVTGGKDLGFSGVIPRDKRAVTITITDITAVGGFVKPGDYVDIVVTYDKSEVGSHTSRVVFQNIQVLALNALTEAGATTTSLKDSKEGTKAMNITLAVSPEQEAAITLADEKGRIRLALRPYMPTQGIIVTNSVTPQDMVGGTPPPANNNNNNNNAPQQTFTPAYQPHSEPSGGIQTIRGTKVETVSVN
jgi:pilus assembly protein CpaB